MYFTARAPKVREELATNNGIRAWYPKSAGHSVVKETEQTCNVSHDRHDCHKACQAALRATVTEGFGTSSSHKM